MKAESGKTETMKFGLYQFSTFSLPASMFFTFK